MTYVNTNQALARNGSVVVGVFDYLDDLLHAIEFAKKSNREYKAYSPCPLHEITHATSHTRSPIRFFTGAAAVAGLCFGFGLAILTGLDWPIRVSAKPIVSIPAFIPVGYETTILIGSITTLLAMLHFTRIPDIFRAPGYDPRFSQDKFGLVIHCDSSELEDIKEQIKNLGAQEVKVGDGL
jgi:hypothetical protein